MIIVPERLLFQNRKIPTSKLEQQVEKAFLDLKILVLGASRSRNKFLIIPEGLVNEETINREVNVGGGPMSGCYSSATDAENDFILNSHILAKLRKEFKNKMILKLTQTSKNQHPAKLENTKNKNQDFLEA